MHQMCALALPTLHHFGDKRYGSMLVTPDLIMLTDTISDLPPQKKN